MGLIVAVACAAGCGDEDDDGLTPPITSGGAGGSDEASPSGGSGGAATNGGSAGSGGAEASAEGGTAGSGDEGEPDEPTEGGETGIFVGATAAHNAIREEASLAEAIEPPLPDLTWSDELAVVAQDWADTLTSEQCGSIGHRPNGSYGENIAARLSRGLSLDPMGPDEAVQGWADEVACWTYGRITGNRPNIQNAEQCEAQCIADLNSTGCGHYTQLVWANTRQVGCGYSTCVNGQDFLVEVWVCNYDPPGNVINQFPYQPGN